MRGRILSCIGFVALAINVPPTANLLAQEYDCTDCHEEATVPHEAGPIEDLLDLSVHAGLDCTDCHQQIQFPDDGQHNKGILACGECHEDAEDDYTVHGRLQRGSNKDLPHCWQCHGAHAIRHSSDPESLVHRTNLPKTCEGCHTNLDVIKNHDVLRDEPLKLFESSVHARPGDNGNGIRATCSDCHSDQDGDGPRTAHRILPSTDAESPVNRYNIPRTCSRCHKDVTAEYEKGIHGQLVAQGDSESPTCTDCHGEHGILPTSDLRSPVSAARVAQVTCARCHESEVLNERFGVPAGELRTFIDSYHGLKKKSGEVHVANCASCHESHRILPASDPASSIHPDNLTHTCGQCHPGITDMLAQRPIHAQAERAGIPQLVAYIYIWLIAGTIGFMVLHNAAHWYRHVKETGHAEQVTRLTASETVQHWGLMISFIVLVITGFSLRFGEAFWVEFLFGWGGGQGFLLRGLIHRIAAVVFMVTSVWHIIYFLTPRGRSWLRDMLPGTRDVSQFAENALYFAGKRDAPPKFGRFGYVEKLEYWALIWGGVVMTVTGLVLWFKNFLAQSASLTQVVLDTMLVIHYYEAWLATLAILIWHLYAVIFSPAVYPMNPAWLRGKMPKDMYHHEHPGDQSVPSDTPTDTNNDKKDAEKE